MRPTARWRRAMNFRNWRAINALVLGLACGAVGATNLVLIGTPSYSISDSYLSYSSKVQNVDSSTSADIRMEIWVFAAPYSGGSLATGFKLAG
jgi:hypothetical protein